MSNALYAKAKEGFLNADIDWLSDTVKALLLDTSLYTVDLDADEFLSDIPVSARVKSSAQLTGRTATLGVADADDTLFASVTAPICRAYAIYQDAAGIIAKSRLIAYCDTGTGLPITPDGGNINLVFPSGSSKIFKL